VTEPLPDVVVAAARLRAAVEHTAAALAGADLERLLASETQLQKALGDIPHFASTPLDARNRAQLRQEVEDAQAVLRRCRRLGAALSDVVRLSLGAQGQGLGYEPARAAAAALTGRTFNERA
jgi:hypothetical protein